MFHSLLSGTFELRPRTTSVRDRSCQSVLSSSDPVTQQAVSNHADPARQFSQRLRAGLLGVSHHPAVLEVPSNDAAQLGVCPPPPCAASCLQICCPCRPSSRADASRDFWSTRGGACTRLSPSRCASICSRRSPRRKRVASAHRGSRGRRSRRARATRPASTSRAGRRLQPLDLEPVLDVQSPPAQAGTSPASPSRPAVAWMRSRIRPRIGQTAGALARRCARP